MSDKKPKAGGEPPAPDAPPDAPPAEAAASGCVVVEVYRSIGFGGVKCAVRTDEKGRVRDKRGEAAKAVVPRDVAEIHERAGRVRIIGPAREGQRPGNIAG